MALEGNGITPRSEVARAMIEHVHGLVGQESQVEGPVECGGAGFVELVDGWVVSEAVGARKPGPAIFELAAQKAAAPLAGAWMVGDSAEADIAGARNAGCRTAWVSRGRTGPIPEFRPDMNAADVIAALAAIR